MGTAVDELLGRGVDTSPESDAAQRSWTRLAACRGMDPAIFFPGRGAPTSEAKAVCARCPVKAECLKAALEERERFGIWGGFSERERRRLRRRVNRGTAIDAVVEETLERGRAA